MSIRTLPDDQPWHDLRPDVRHALEALYSGFEDLRRTYGNPTQVLCRDCIHDTSGDHRRAFGYEFDKLWASIPDEWWSPEVRDHYFFSLTRPETQSFTFREYFNFYLDILVIGARRAFAELVEISPKHEADGIAWATSQAQQLIWRQRPSILNWVRQACDRDVTDPWQAPSFLTMQPAGPDLYDPERALLRMDAASSFELLQALAAEYVRKLENCIEKAAGDAYIAIAKHPKSAGKIIDAKLVKGSGPGAREIEVDAKAKARSWRSILKQKDDPDATRPISAIAWLLGVEPKTVRNRIQREKLPRHPTNGRVYVQTAIRLREPKPPKRKTRRRRKR